MIEVLVLLLLDFLERLGQRLLLLALDLFRRLVEQLPVEVVLRLGMHDTLARHQLGRLGRTLLAGHFHGRDQGCPDVVHHLPAGGLLVRPEPELLHQAQDDLLVLLGLLQIFLPLLLQVVVLDAAQGGLVDLDPSALRFQHLVDELAQLLVLHVSGLPFS